MQEIRWAAFARRDLERIYAHYEAVGSTLGITMLERIVAATRIIAEMPKAGQATLNADRRRWRVPKTESLLFYRVERDYVRILRVVHGAQQIAGRL